MKYNSFAKNTGNLAKRVQNCISSIGVKVVVAQLQHVHYPQLMLPHIISSNAQFFCILIEQ